MTTTKKVQDNLGLGGAMIIYNEFFGHVLSPHPTNTIAGNSNRIIIIEKIFS